MRFKLYMENMEVIVGLKINCMETARFSDLVHAWSCNFNCQNQSELIPFSNWSCASLLPDKIAAVFSSSKIIKSNHVL